MKIFTERQFDGSEWHRYETPDSHVFLTSQGRELFGKNHGVSKSLREYAREAQIEYATPRNGSYETRTFLAEGQNARVFNVEGTGLVVKEKKTIGDDILKSLGRMDRLVSSVESHAPRWVDIPRHYGALVLKSDLGKQYLLMEKVDAGVSVGDIVAFREGLDGAREPHLYNSVEDNFGSVTEDLVDEVESKFQLIRYILRDSLLSDGLSPDVYLPDLDYNRYNVLVEKIDTPVAGSDKKYWVIDQ